MIKLVHSVSTRHLRVVLCGCAAVLLSACGGNGGATSVVGPANRTAAEVIDSKTPAVESYDPRNPAAAEAAAAAAIAGTGADETAGPAAMDPAPGQAAAQGEPPAAVPYPEQSVPTSVEPAVPGVPAASAHAAAAGAARIFVAATAAPAAL